MNFANYQSGKLESALQQAYNRLSLAIEASGVGFWDWNLKTNEVYFDRQWLNLIGFQEEELTVNHTFWEERIHPGDKENVLNTLDKHLNNIDLIYKTEHRIRRKDGTYIWVLDTGRVIERDAFKKPLRIIGTTIDITEKVVNREKIKESEEKYRSIFNHLNDGFCRFDFEGNILEVNQNLCVLLQMDENELVKNNIKFFFPNSVIKFLYRRFKKLIDNQSIDFETNIITKQRKEFPININARLIVSSGNGIIQAVIKDITERKTYERTLLEERNKLNALIEHSPNVIARFGKNLKCLYISPNSKRILGMEPETILGRKLSDTIIPKNLASFIEDKFKQSLRKNKEIKFTFSFDSPLGLKFYETIVLPEINDTSVSDTLIVTYTDITDITLREKELVISRQKYEEAERNVHFGVFEYDFVTNNKYWSNETYTIFERSPELPPPSFDELLDKYIHPDDIYIFLNQTNEKLEEFIHFEYTYRIITDAGKVKYINSIGNFEIDTSVGLYKKVSATIKDITELKQIEDKLFTERDTLQLIIESLPDAIYIKDFLGNYVRCNKALAKTVGLLNADDITGKTTYDLFPIDIANEIIEMEQNILIKNEKIINVEKSYKKGAENIWLSHTLIAIRDTTENIVKIVGIIRDITIEKHIQYDLVKAKEKAENADKLKSAFLANMSHEIRTPINGILGFANLLEMRDFSREKEVQYLQIINNSGKLLLNLVNDIIDIAKIEAGQINIQHSEVNLPAMFHDLAEFYHGEKVRRAKEDIEFKIEIPSNEKYHFIVTDPLRLRQIINNLISNALKFSDLGYIEFGYQPVGRNLLFFVKDTGIGIHENEIQIIFDRFKQAGLASRKKEGTGLGLAISKGLVELLGGKIWVKSENGKGSEFYFTIPLHESNIKSNEGASKPVMSSYIVSDWKDKTILLVEDEEVNYLYVKELLDNTGIILLHAPTGEDAIQLCKSSVPVDLVLMDMRLPGINGFEATKQIKRIRENIPVIAQTAYAMENERQDCIDAGCDHYITKPFDQDLLFGVLNNFLFKSVDL
jgi:PAS domain S-box-containing protein